MDYRIFIIIIFHLVLLLKDKIINSFLLTVDLLVIFMSLNFSVKIILLFISVFFIIINIKILGKTFMEYLPGYLTVVVAGVYFYLYRVILKIIPELKFNRFHNDDLFIFLYLLVLYLISIVINEKVSEKIKHS